MLFTPILTITFEDKVTALTGSDWQAGRIIDDEIFYDKDSMSIQEIQTFLEEKVPVCDYWHPSSDQNSQPPWTCIKEYQENTTTKENNIGRFNSDGSPFQVPGGKSAAQIIWEAGQAHGINPQVLIVMLQKHEGLITDSWPSKYKFGRAMGYACPDAAPCNEQYYGFYNQVSSAAWQFKRYVTYPDWYNFKTGATRYIQYNHNTACGGSQVFIENTATAALYNYTPYQPNAGTLDNLYGSAECGSYGNRDFWRYFNEWFGSTYVQVNPPTASIKVNNQDVSTTIEYDSEVILHWYSDNTNSCEVNPGGYTDLTNTITVYEVTENIAYSIQCYGEGGEVFDEVKVIVLPPTFEYLLKNLTELGNNSGVNIRDTEQQILNASKFYEKDNNKKAIHSLNQAKDSINKLIDQGKTSLSEGNKLLYAIDVLISSWQ